MFEPWIWLSVGAAFCQNLRSALQKHLKGRLSTSGAAYVRFLYALPLSLVLLAGWQSWSGESLPEVNARFLVFCLLGGVSQILFTVLLLWLFSFRNFAVGTTFSKLELVQVALLGTLILGDELSTTAVAAVAISAVGVVALSIGQSQINLRTLLQGLFSAPTAIGLASAATVGGSVIFFRGAALSLSHDGGVMMTAAFTLTVALLIQTVLMGLYLRWREPGEITRVLREWRWASAVGVVGMVGSIGWFAAFTLQNAAYVRAVGQVELMFTYIATTVFFRERVDWRESVGIVLVVAAILLLLLGE